MPYVAGNFDQPHIYLQWGGSLPGGEQWSNGMRITNPGQVGTPISLATSESYLTNAMLALATFHASADTYVSSRAKLEYAKANVIGLDGKYVYPTANEGVYTPISGAGPNHPPNQISLAVSLTTDVTRGPAHRGRIYLPMPSHEVGATGLISAEARNPVITSALALIAALNTDPSGLKVAVMSRKSGSPSHRQVTGVEVGRVLDTQRRRRRSLAETY